MGAPIPQQVILAARRKLARRWPIVAAVGMLAVFAICVAARAQGGCDAFTIVAAPAQGGSDAFTIDGNGNVSDWSKVEKCAAKPYATTIGKDVSSEEWIQSSSRFNQISLCRYLLVGFNAGWVKAGKPAKASPYPIAEVNNKDDFRFPLKCASDNHGVTVDCELDSSRPRREP